VSQTPTSVEAMYNDDHAPTAPLDEFLAAYLDDDNWWWRISCGHHMNLFDEAIERIDLARAQHQRADFEPRMCVTCNEEYPCTTRSILDGRVP
jgi:hypothetical protein